MLFLQTTRNTTNDKRPTTNEFTMLTRNTLLPLIELALKEDIGSGDITSQLTVPAEAQAVMHFRARQKLVAAGVEVPGWVMKAVDSSIECKVEVKEGAVVEAGQVMATFRGNARALLGAERTALNLLQRACGVATLTRKYVDAVAGTKAVILDTRKTMPGLRALDKHAVVCGGGKNHRMGLYDAVMVKDNHLGIRDWALGIREVIEKARHPMPNAQSLMPIIIECDTLAQVKEVLEMKPTRILLDNMSQEDLRSAVAMVGGQVPLEASGGVTLETVRVIAEAGVDFISVGALTHSAPAVDIGADREMK